jgi:hypothetical protein
VTAPCRLDHAVDAAVDGDEVVVLPGDYAVSYPVQADAPISVHGQTGRPRPRLIGDSAMSNETLALDAGGAVSHLYVEGTGVGQDALSLEGATGDDLVVVSSSGDAVNLKGAPGGTVLRDSVVRSTAGSHAAVHTKDQAPPSLPGGPVELRNVTAIADGAGGDAISAKTTDAPTTLRNVIARGGDSDVGTTNGGLDVHVAYSSFRPDKSDHVIDEGHNQAADPRFLDAAAGDFHELPDSPTVDAGTADPLNGATDPGGHPRQVGSAPDIGAYEFVADPAAVTGPAADVTPTSATLTGFVTPNGGPTTYHFEYGASTAYGASTGDAPAGAGDDPQLALTALAGLVPGSVYHYRVVASRPTGVATGADATLTTPLAPEVRPVVGRRFDAAPLAGTVRVRVPGSRRFVVLRRGAALPVGSLVDTRRGKVSLTSARDSRGTTQSGAFHGGLFQVRQARSRAPVTDLVLRGAGFSACSPRPRRSASAARVRRVRRLWGSDRGGRFRTTGRWSSASVRGTVWLVEDRCDGTLTLVTRGSVAVRDGRRHRTVLVRAGSRYLARR